jgi:hypothetical protein
MFDRLLRSVKLTYWNKRQHKKPRLYHLKRGDGFTLTLNNARLVFSFERDGLHLTLVEKKASGKPTSPPEPSLLTTYIEN